MKILSIGNSFSQDAHKWLNQIADSVGVELYCANLYIGGCSLERHWNNYLSREDAYDYEISGKADGKISLSDALVKEDWDVITLQQVSGFSGIFSTFEPYLSDLIKAIREICPNAEILLHKTWAYEADSEHPDFKNYGCSTDKMYDEITKAYSEASEKTGLKVILSGDIIQFLRKNVKEFDVENGGLKLTRDSFHLSYNYGRFAVSLVWLKTLTGINAEKVTFVPQADGMLTDCRTLDTIKNAVDKIPQIQKLL